MGKTGKQLIILWAVTLGAIAGGVTLVWTMPAPVRSGCDGAPKGATMDHLARCDHKVTATASTTDRGGGHDPLFLIDGRIGSEPEKWVSSDGDDKPWILLQWPAPKVISKVVIHHAGLREDPGYDTRDFIIEARVDGKWLQVQQVRNNMLHVTTHAFMGVNADQLRITITGPAVNGNSRARIYEVEVR